MTKHAAGEQRVELLVFAIGPQRYALRLHDVEEIVRAVTVVRLPSAPGITEGVIDIRGRVVPLLDVRRRFGFPPREIDLDDQFVVARAAGRVVALRADGPTRLVPIDAAAIEDARKIVPSARYIAGTASLPDGVALIVDLSTFLSAAESDALDAAMTMAPLRAETYA